MTVNDEAAILNLKSLAADKARKLKALEEADRVYREALDAYHRARSAYENAFEEFSNSIEIQASCAEGQCRTTPRRTARTNWRVE